MNKSYLHQINMKPPYLHSHKIPHRVYRIHVHLLIGFYFYKYTGYGYPSQRDQRVREDENQLKRASRSTRLTSCIEL